MIQQKKSETCIKEENDRNKQIDHDTTDNLRQKEICTSIFPLGKLMNA